MQLSKCQENFKEFYAAQNSSRVLTWQPSLASCVLRCDFAKGQKELHLSLFQAVVLLAFNIREEWNYDDLQKHVGIEEKDLKRTLQSLACAKYKILKKTPMSKEVHSNDVFIVNPDFTNEKNKFKVPMVQAKQEFQEQKETQDEINLIRQHQLDAAIVRVMKSRKTMSHRDLVSSIPTMVKFPVSVCISLNLYCY